MSKNTTNNRGRGGGGRGGGGRGRGGRGGRGGGGAAGNGSTISLVTDQPFETLSTEEQDMIKYLHRVSKNSKSAFSAILKKEDNEAPSAAVADDSSSSTLQNQQHALQQQVDTPPVVHSTVGAPVAAVVAPVVAVAHPGFTLPPKRNKRSRDDDDDDRPSAAASSQPVVTSAVVLSIAVASPAPAAGSLLPKPPSSSMSIIGKWRSQLQALAPPSLPLNWLPNVTFVQSTQNRFQAHRSRIEAMRTETIEAISHFHDFNEEDEVNNNNSNNEEGTTTVLHIGRRIGGGAGNSGAAGHHHHHHKSISEASGRSKYSSVQSGSDGVGADEEVEGRPSTHTLKRIQAIFNAIMTTKQQGEESASSSRIHELITKNLPASRCPWSQGFTKAQQEDIAAAAASIAVRVPYLLAPLGHVLVSSTLTEDEEGLTDLQVAEGLVSSIGFFPLQQSLMSMWFHCLSLCIGSSVRQIDTEGASSHTASCRGSALLPPVRPLMTMFALVGDGDTNNLLHAVLGVILNGAEGVVGSVVGAKSQVAEAETEPVCEDEGDDDDMVRPGKGMASSSLDIENEDGDKDEEDEYVPKEAGAVAILQLPPAPGAESLKAYAAAASVNTQIVRAWRHSLHSADTTTGLLQCVDTCVTSLYPVASVGLDDFQAGGGAAPTCSASSDSLNKVVEALRFTAQLVPLGYQRRLSSAAQGQVLPIKTSGMGEWLYTAFAAVELPLDPQGDIQMQRLYRLTLRTIHTLRTATQDIPKLATLLLYPRLDGGIESDVDRVVAGFLALMSVGGGGKTSSLSCLTSFTHTQLSNAISQAVDRILAAHETNLTILCKFFISHNKDLVPI